MSFKIGCLPVLHGFHCCCCSCNLKNATVALGWIQAVASCLQLAWFSVYLLKPEEVTQLLWFGKEVRIVCFGHLLRFDWRLVSIAMVSEAAVFEVCCLLLLYGAHREKPGYMIPHLLVFQLGIGLLVLITVISGLSELFRTFSVGLGIIIGGATLVVVASYLWLVKYSFYRKLVEINRRKRARKDSVPSVKPTAEQLGLTLISENGGVAPHTLS